MTSQSLVIDPNVAQRAAADPLQSVWVNASAGSGKTKVLTERVTRLLLSGVRPEKILCLTYTRAGAAEMANRVTAMLSKWAVCDDQELDKDLHKLQGQEAASKQRIGARRLFARVLACPGGLRIRTIHSFCQEILSRFPVEAGLPPHFALIDEQDMAALKDEVLDDVLREAAENPQSSLAQALSDLIATQNESGITKMLHEIINARGRLQGTGGGEKWSASLRAMLNLRPGDTPEKLKAGVMAALPEEALRRLAGFLAQGTKTHSQRGVELCKILDASPQERAGKFADYCLLFLTKENVQRKAFADTKTLQKYPEIEEISVNESVRLLAALAHIEAADIARITQGALVFGRVFSEKLAARKKAIAALDYDDLILLTENLLQRSGISPWILYKLDNGIDHILVDEAQDTSRAQWGIVQALTAEFYAGAGANADKGRTLFVVGDEKQSIFSFQNADPEAFLSYRDFFSRHLHDAGKNLERIGLHTSFRSAPAVLRAVDTIFGQEKAREGVSSEDVTHSPFKNPDGSDKVGRVEIWPLLKADKDKSEKGGEWILPTGYEDETDPQVELAQQIALKIKGWLSKQDILPGGTRPIAPGDIMILLRRRGQFAPLMVRALKAHNVPVTGVDRMHLIEQLPVMDLLSAIRFVLLPEDDLNLATLLRSPLMGLSEDQLMEIAIGREGSLWHSLQASPSFKDVSDYLALRLSEADFSTPFMFLSNVLNRPCPGNPQSGRKAIWARLGDESLDPIEELLNKAQSFSRRQSPSLQNFLQWLTRTDAEIKRELDHGGGQVRIMTVHASKGLEAPIVFLPDTTALPRPTDIPKLQWDENTPLFLTRRPDFGAAKDIWDRARNKQMQEYRRLLYVALTRAANQLYICGWLGTKSENAPEESWYMLARTALAPHSQEHHIGGGENPRPDIVVADALTSQSSRVLAEKPQPVQTALPAWAFQLAENTPQPVAILPSQSANDPVATPDAAFARGRIIHRLLQSLPSLPSENRGAAIARFLAQARHNLTQAQRDEIAREVEALLNNENFAALFAPGALAEVPLTGTLGGVSVFRQIDRLCMQGDEVWIVDYKTNRPPPSDAKDIPAAYRQQVNEYRLLLQDIYPGKLIRCFLLWTYAPRLMEVEFGSV